MKTVIISKKTFDDLLQVAVWFQEELLKQQEKETTEDDTVWLRLADRISEIEKIKEQARLEVQESML